MTWATVAEIRAANLRNRGSWFDPETMRAFSSKIETGVVHGRFFVSSKRDEEGLTIRGEKIYAWDGERRYSIRRADAHGRIETVGNIDGGYSSVDYALDALDLFVRRSDPSLYGDGSS